MTRPDTARAIIADSLDNLTDLADRYVYPRSAMEKAHGLIWTVGQSVASDHWIGATEALGLLKLEFSAIPQASVKAEAYLDIDAAMSAVDEAGVLDAMFAPGEVAPNVVWFRAPDRAEAAR